MSDKDTPPDWERTAHSLARHVNEAIEERDKLQDKLDDILTLHVKKKKRIGEGEFSRTIFVCAECDHSTPCPTRLIARGSKA